jgi:Na+/H+ antiporter NhaD/arsenite permease-like protein
VTTHQLVAGVFLLVYAGMVLGRVPRLRLDRTGIALLGAIAMVLVDGSSLEEATNAVDVPTLALLFALMVVSAQLRLGGFYGWVATAIARAAAGPATLLGLLVVTAGVLSAVFSNDVVCLATAPVLVRACRRRGLDPVPFLLALACAANVGSAATLIGNPQNMLIGQALGLSFADYMLEAAVPTLLGLGVTWGVIAYRQRDHWRGGDAATGDVVAAAEGPAPANLDRWQTAKGLAAATFLMVAFLFLPWSREVVALAAAGLLLTSRRLHSRDMLGLVDWQLLVLFIGLFVVNDALARTGLPAEAVASLQRGGIDLTHPPWLFAATALLSNAVSNVPAVMLLLPLATHPSSGPLLALVSTLSGNLLVVGSIANIIVVETAARDGIDIDWRRHALTGVPVTLATLALAALYLALRAGVI